MKSSRHSTGLNGRELKRLLIALCDCAHRDVTRLAGTEEVAIHQLRVRMKKILALLRLAADGVEHQSMKAMRQHARAIKNAWEKRREDAVRDKLIDKLVHRHHLRLKPSLPDPVKPHDDGPSSSFLRHQLHALEQLIDKTRIESISSDQILERHGRCYRKGRHRLKEVAESHAETVLHHWRHQVKDLYFQTLVLTSIPGARHRLRRARRLGSLLGRDHDFAALAREPAFRSRRGPWPDIIQERRQAIHQRSLTIGRKLFAIHSSRFHHRLLCLD